MPAAVESTLGWVYIGLTAGWTVILAAGMLFLHHHRQLPFLQMRKLPLIYTAIFFLHAYGALVMVGYTIAPLIPCDALFWIMSLWLPLGVALLQAANSQFLSIATQQKRFADMTNDLDAPELSPKTTAVDPSAPWWKRTIQMLGAADETTRILIYVSVGMVVQVLLTCLVYFGSAMFHPSYGIFDVQVGNTTAAVNCQEGWEWWLSIAWQFFWSWVYAPFMLWRTRNIHDVHGWRTQTILCCLAGLPASPLWLAGLYSPQMAPVNAVLIPPQWFSISIFFIEVFTIFIPVWQVIKTHQLKQETLDTIAEWEEKNKHLQGDLEVFSIHTAGLGGTTLGGRESIAGKSALTGKTGNSKTSTGSRRSELYTMAALENALRNNPKPLLEFAALKDFSGENISFLTHVAEWKKSWATVKPISEKQRGQFLRATRIFAHFISLEYSDFPVNISSKGAKDLLRIFGRAADLLNRRNSKHSGVTPFDDDTPSEMTGSASDLEGTLGKANLQAATRMVDLSSDGHINLPIPDSFNAQVFDEAENEIKYLVLTNTWPKFVNAGQLAQMEQKGVLDGVRKMFCGIERIV